jgi:hypothetical protein
MTDGSNTVLWASCVAIVALRDGASVQNSILIPQYRPLFAQLIEQNGSFLREFSQNVPGKARVETG